MTKTLFVPPQTYFSNVNRYTRAGKNGKDILYPECREWGTVYHFSWSALQFQSCKESVNHGEADCHTKLTSEQEDWLSCYITVWDLAAANE